MSADGPSGIDDLRLSMKPIRVTRELTFSLHPRLERTTPEKGGAERCNSFDTL